MRHLSLILGTFTLAVAYWFRDSLTTYLPASGVDFSMTRNDVRKALRLVASNNGFDPNWFDAIAKIESRWQLDAVNNTGGDARLGGAYGPMQMTARTAQRLGFNAQDFLTDPILAGEAAAKYLRGIDTFENVCSYWNAGVVDFNKLGPNHVTRTNYYPKAVDALLWVLENPPGV